MACDAGTRSGSGGKFLDIRMETSGIFLSDDGSCLSMNTMNAGRFSKHSISPKNRLIPQYSMLPLTDRSCIHTFALPSFSYMRSRCAPLTGKLGFLFSTTYAWGEVNPAKKSRGGVSAHNTKNEPRWKPFTNEN